MEGAVWSKAAPLHRGGQGPSINCLGMSVRCRVYGLGEFTFQPTAMNWVKSVAGRTCPALSYRALLCPTLPCPDLPYPAVPCPAVPCPALPCRALPCPCPALPWHALPCPDGWVPRFTPRWIVITSPTD